MCCMISNHIPLKTNYIGNAFNNLEIEILVYINQCGKSEMPDYSDADILNRNKT